MPDGRRSLASEAKRLDNTRRAHESGLAAPRLGFFQQDILRGDASQRERDVARSLLRGAEERAARANHGSKDKRLGTSLSKYELLLRVLPAMRPFEPLRFEGDLETSERNEVLLVAIAEFIRRNPKATGGLVRADSVSGQVSGVKAIVEEHLGRRVLAPSGGRVLARELRQMRLEDGPSAGRALSLPLRNDHLDRLAAESSGFDVRSPGWPTARYALLRAMHQGLMRGGEPGTLPGEPFRPALGVCWGDFTWHDHETGDLLMRDGNGLLKWFMSFHDITTPSKQMALRLKLSKFKIGLDFSQKQLLKMLLDYLTTWEKLLGNNRNDRVLLNDFYVKLLDLWPHEPYDNPIVRTRSVVANMQLGNDAMLADVAATINEWMKASKSYGVPVGKSYSNSPPGTVLALGDRLTAADNNCTFCDVFGCKAKSELKTCVVYNSAVPVGAGSQFPKDMQVRFVKGAREHLKQERARIPTLTAAR